MELRESTQETAVKFRKEKAWPNRYYWTCGTCRAENRYFEFECPYCLHRKLDI